MVTRCASRLACKHLGLLRVVAGQCLGLLGQCLGALGDVVDLRDIALLDGLLDIQMHAVQRPQQHHVHAVVAARALHVLAAVAHQLLQLHGDGLDVVEHDAEVDDVVADHGGEQELDLLVAEVEAHGAQFRGELLLDPVEFGAIATDVLLALVDEAVVILDGPGRQRLGRCRDSVLAITVDLGAGAAMRCSSGLDLIAIALYRRCRQDRDRFVSKLVDLGLGVGLVAAKPGPVRQVALGLFQRYRLFQLRHDVGPDRDRRRRPVPASGTRGRLPRRRGWPRASAATSRRR
jgi:hypothetical protein